MKKNVLTFIAGAAMLFGASKADAQITFFEGNGCTEDVVISFANTTGNAYNLTQITGTGYNDEARSMKLQGYFPNGKKITIYDSPNYDFNDDWIEVKVSPYAIKDLIWPPNPPLDICIPSFENSGATPGVPVTTAYPQGGGFMAYVTITYHPHNGLNGKVSRIDIWDN